MSETSSDVKVTIEMVKATGRAEFGIPLIFAGVQDRNIEYTECAELETVAAVIARAYYADGDTEEEKAAKLKEAKNNPVYHAAQLLFMQNNPPDRIAVCASKEKAVDALPRIKRLDWRQLIVVSTRKEGESSIREIAAYIESLAPTYMKMYFAGIDDIAIQKNIESKTVGMDRTMIFYHKPPVGAMEYEKYPEAALAGAAAGKKAGSFTYKNFILKGLTPQILDGVEIDNIHDLGCIAFVTKAGDNVTTEGKTTSGEYVDIIDSKDWIITQITYQTQRVLNMYDKVKYDNVGIAALESVCVSVLKDAFLNGMIAVDADGAPDYTVNYGRREESDPNDRVKRIYALGRFRFALAGAVHEVNVKGTIEV